MYRFILFEHTDHNSVNWFRLVHKEYHAKRDFFCILNDYRRRGYTVTKMDNDLVALVEPRHGEEAFVVRVARPGDLDEYPALTRKIAAEFPDVIDLWTRHNIHAHQVALATAQERRTI